MSNTKSIKDQVKIVEGFVWPVADVSSFNGQKEHLHIHEHLMKHVTNHSVLVQAGGNCGMVLNTLVDYFDTTYTFEPDPVNFYCLNQNTTDPRVVKIQGCLGNDTNPVKIQMVDWLSDIGSFHVSGHGTVPVFRLDDLKLNDCGLIFLDVEGFEYEVLLGSIETIKKYKPTIFLEVCPPWLGRYNASPETLSSFLTSINYKKVKNIDSGEVANNELWTYVETSES